MREPHKTVRPSPPHLPASSVLPDRAGPLGLPRGSKEQSRVWGLAEPGPEHCWQKAEDSCMGGACSRGSGVRLRQNGLHHSGTCWGSQGMSWAWTVLGCRTPVKSPWLP